MYKTSLWKTAARAALACVAAVAALAAVPSAKALDFNVDPYNLGKGDWIYFLSTATNKLGGNVTSVSNVNSLMKYYTNQGLTHFIIKAGTGAAHFNGSGSSPQVNAALVTAAHNVGLKIFAYTRSDGIDVPGEITLANGYLAMGCDGFVIDAEIEWESQNLANGPAKAIQLCQGIKNVYPNRFLGHSPFMYIGFHSSFPYKEFGFYCDAVMPQDYWTDFGITPAASVVDLEDEWSTWQNSLSGQWTNSIKPIAPIGNAYHTGMPASEITSFVNALKGLASPATWYGYKSVTYWRTDLHTSAMWTQIKNNNIEKTTAASLNAIADSGIADTSAKVYWETDISGNSVVQYGLTTSYGSTYTDTNPVVRHNVTLTGLTPNTLYHYRVRSTNARGQVATSGDFTFTTLPAGVVNDIIIDNINAAFTGSWVTASSAGDKFGTDYRYKAQGTGTAFADFIPTIVSAGNYQVYEWHSAGGNRGADTPHIITHSGGSATVPVDQQTAGGQWNLLGTYNFNTGTAGKVRITDNISGSSLIAMADAIKFVYAQAIPAAPSGLSATTVSASQINLAWTDNSGNETGFTVARSTTSGGPYTDIATTGANVTSYNSTGLSAATTYYYVVRAVGASGSSANSAQASATTLPNPPAAPSGLSATTISASQINLAWTDNSGNETSFTVGRSTTSGGPYTDITTTGANVTSFNNTGLTASTTYYYVVRAGNTGGSSANSAQASATTTAIAPPTAPSGLSATVVSQAEISLSWTDNSTTESSFILARSTTSGGPYTDVATVGANTTAYSNTGLSAATTYYYVVRAANAGGSSANSAQASGTTLPFPPSAPGGLAATAISSSQINLSWTDNSPNESNFIVARSTTSGGPYTDIATLGANVTTYNNTGLAAGTTYYYVVRAINSGGSSGNSNQGSATTLTALPTAPSGLTATALNGVTIRLAWTDNSSNESNFIVGRSTTSGGPYTDIATVGANVTTYTNVSLTPNTTYYYVVRASNGSGSSANTAQASATTPTVSDIIIDNLSATVTGTWSSGTSSTDKFSTDYRFKSGGTGAAFLTFTPTIVTPGNYQVYEWHPQGSNRTTNAPVVVTYNGGNFTGLVNQKVNGGVWIAVGSPVNFVAGTAGNVKITDNFPDATQVVMADAIKFVFVP